VSRLRLRENSTILQETGVRAAATVVTPAVETFSRPAIPAESFF
jgi:hypothetical protein